MMRAMLALLAAGCSAPAHGLPGVEGLRVLFFVGPECPVSNFYAPEIERLSKRGPQALLVYSEPGVTEEIAARHAREYRLTAPRILDPDHAYARRLGVSKIPTAVLVDGNGILYRGRIDDRYTPEGKRRAEPRSRELEAAIDAVRAGGRPEVSETPVFGCPLALKEVSK
jgi:hypothetical protein